MIIFIDGTYGSGKSAVSYKLQEKLNDSILFDADEYYHNEWIKSINEEAQNNPNIYLKAYACNSSILVENRFFLEDYSNYILKHISEKKYQIINMCLLNDTYYKYFYQKFILYEYKHFILFVNKLNLIKRASSQKNREVNYAISFYEDNVGYINKYEDAYVIDVNDISVDEVVLKCLNFIE